MYRRIVIGSSWKMTKTRAQAREFVDRLRQELGAFDPAVLQVYLLPPFTALDAVARSLGDYPVDLGAQNVFWEDEGPFTGEVSPVMLEDLGCKIVMLGHSERRRLFGETDETINKKVLAALRHGLAPLLCVGEEWAEHEAGKDVEVLRRQLSQELRGVTAEQATRVIMLYEPVWAIGQKASAPPEHVQKMHAATRSILAGLYGADVAGRTRVIYGGSVNLPNLPDLLALPDVDGCGVSRAAWDPVDFARMVKIAEGLARRRAHAEVLA
jgi:triosephosphate isomerase (TIM)